MSPEMVLVEMAEAGVDGAVLSPIGVYGTDNTLEIEASARFPRKFCAIGWIDHLAQDVNERLQADAAKGMRGVRIWVMRDSERHDRGEFFTALDSCERLGLAVAVSLVHPIDSRIIEIFRRYAGINFLIDHLGVGIAPPIVLGDEPFRNLPDVLNLATLPNVYLKLTGAPALSKLQFPFEDLWEPIKRIVDAFGVNHVAWGSDFTRTSALHSYWDGANYLREVPGMSADDLAAIYGRTLRQALNWHEEAPRRAAIRTH
jgi:L-fuconolactonase